MSWNIEIQLSCFLILFVCSNSLMKHEKQHVWIFIGSGLNTSIFISIKLMYLAFEFIDYGLDLRNKQNDEEKEEKEL